MKLPTKYMHLHSEASANHRGLTYIRGAAALYINNWGVNIRFNVLVHMAFYCADSSVVVFHQGT